MCHLPFGDPRERRSEIESLWPSFLQRLHRAAGFTIITWWWGQQPSQVCHVPIRSQLSRDWGSRDRVRGACSLRKIEIERNRSSTIPINPKRSGCFIASSLRNNFIGAAKDLIWQAIGYNLRIMYRRKLVTDPIVQPYNRVIRKNSWYFTRSKLNNSSNSNRSNKWQNRSCERLYGTLRENCTGD